jgi:hypothetical protein
VLYDLQNFVHVQNTSSCCEVWSLLLRCTLLAVILFDQPHVKRGLKANVGCFENVTSLSLDEF